MRRAETASQRGIVDMGKIQAAVLCGGLGTRLQSAVPNLPKSLAPIAGRPFLDYLLAVIAASGIRSVVLCTGYGREALEKAYGSGGCSELQISHCFEDTAMGTAGALRHALKEIRSNPFLVLNGDSLLDICLAELVAA